ncbi:hypothetical protein HDU86_005194 [Geranomyces michiganensis]|nr:hypothetical protein HDU86_005194 [Geranomyces michiganensis]
MSLTPRDCKYRLPVTSLEIAVQEWGPTDGTPILCLHGWLDNSETWSLFLPLFLAKNPHCFAVAVDFPGHGRSAHKGPEADYGFYEFARDTIALVNVLGWSRFAILGHSLGGYVGFMIASAFPARVTHLMSVEAMHPIIRTNKIAASRLVRALQFHEAISRKGRPAVRRTYPSLAAIATLRAEWSPLMPLSQHAAEILMARNTTVASDGTVENITDVRLKDPAPHTLSAPIANYAFAKIACPVLVVLGADGIHAAFPGANDVPNGTPKLDVRELPGRHHLHLDDDVPQVVECVCAWLADHPLLARSKLEEGGGIAGTPSKL